MTNYLYNKVILLKEGVFVAFDQTIGIVTEYLEEGKAVLKLPITEAVLQPFGYLHGGVSVALAEHAASMAASKSIQADEIVFGLEINANHLASKQSGILTATALPFHIGKSSQVWEVKITDENNRLICISRCTIAVKKKRS